MHKQKPVYRSIIYMFMCFIKVDFVAILAVDFSGVAALDDIFVPKTFTYGCTAAFTL